MIIKSKFCIVFLTILFFGIVISKSKNPRHDYHRLIVYESESFSSDEFEILKVGCDQNDILFQSPTSIDLSISINKQIAAIFIEHYASYTSFHYFSRDPPAIA